MNNNDYITEKATEIISRCGTRNPFKIAKELGIETVWWDGFSRLKGMYRVIKRNRYIFLNSNLPERTAKIVCAHEIGHDQFHREFAKTNGLQEFTLYNMVNRQEYEANIFAASLLLSDDDILEYISMNFDAEQIARSMETDVNLVALKCDNLRSLGYNLNKLEHKSNFLK